MELHDQRTHAGNDSGGRDQGDTESDEELAGSEQGGDEAGNLESDEEISLEEDGKAEASTAQLEPEVESEIDSVLSTPDPEVFLPVNARRHLTGTHCIFYPIL